MNTILNIFAVIMTILLFRGIFGFVMRHRGRRGAMIRRCRSCNSIIPYGASVCPHCGCDPGSDEVADFKTGKATIGDIIGTVFRGIIILLIAVFILIAIYFIHDVITQKGIAVPSVGSNGNGNSIFSMWNRFWNQLGESISRLARQSESW